MNRPWTLDAPSFERLLSALNADRDRAAVAYEQLRERITGLLEWWGARPADELADETLDRVARKLDEGAVIADGVFGAYVRGVARMVFFEWTRRPKPVSEFRDVVMTSGDDDTRDEALLARVDTCLDSLSPADRDLVLRYYAEGKAADIRRRLAAELGLSPTALRIRAHRLRVRLERSLGVGRDS